MKFANYQGRLQLVTAAGYVDVARASGDRLPSSPAAAYEQWNSVLEWAATKPTASATSIAIEDLDAPSSAPRQVFAIGLNYAPHAKESGFDVPAYPYVFTKTSASLTGPYGNLVLPSETIDWEVEIVAVIGREARHVSKDQAWDYVAGLTIGQDYSDRTVQSRLGPNSQPTLGKSAPGFSPTGPYLVTPDEFPDPDDIALATVIDGIDMQRSRSSGLIFSIPALIEYLSDVLPLYPGDMIFTGTPEGVGYGRNPRVYLKPGNVIETQVEGIGSIRQVAVAAS